MTNLNWNDRLSYIAIAILSLVVFLMFFSPILRQDGILYVSPARSLLLEGDLNTYNENAYYVRPGWNSVLHREITGKTRTMIKYESAPEYTPQGYKHVVFPIGNSLSWLPCLTLTHLVMKGTDGFGGLYAADGYSYPYILMLGWFSFFIGVTGFIVAYRFLRKFYSPGVSCASLIFGVAAGNLIPFMCIDVTFSHSLDFLLINLFLLLAVNIDIGDKTTGQRNCFWQDAFWGLICGWTIITRYQDVFLLFLPITIYLFQSFKQSRTLVFKRALWFAVSCLLVGTLQLGYWKILYGQVFVSGSLMGTGNLPSFNPLKPELLKMLFSRFHGLFSWMPVLLPVSLTAFLFPKRSRKIGIVFLAIFLLETYYNASRTEWWNLGFSVRRFSGWHIFFMIGAAELIVLFRQKTIRIILAVTSMYFLVWNWLFMMHFYMRGNPQSVANDILSGSGPFGQTHYSIIWPDLKLIIKSLASADLWLSRCSWIEFPTMAFRSGNSGLGITAILLHMCIIGLIGIYVLYSQKIRAIRYKAVCILFLGYMLIAALAMGYSQCSAVNVQSFKPVDGSLVPEDHVFRVHPSHLFLGENNFVEFDSLRLDSRLINRKLPEKSNWIIGVPKGEQVQLELFEEVRNQIQPAGIIVVDKTSSDVRYLEKPWGSVSYKNDWYHYQMSLQDVNSDQLILKTGNQSMITFAAMFAYQER